MSDTEDEKQFRDRYEIITFLGEGQFATVYKARDKETDRIVAVKKIKLGNEYDVQDGINRTALREVKFLLEVKHPNVIELLDIIGRGLDVSLVFDFMDTDLEVIIKDTSIIFTAGHIKAYALMVCLGLKFLHDNWILHRDLKPNNLLINKNGVLKIGDFGLAKYYASPARNYTHQVVTRWYRCPELLFGARKYGTGVDMWAVGCIIAELMLRVPFLPGESDLDQLTRIFQALGTPTAEYWPDMTSLQDFIQFKYYPGTPLRKIFSAASDDLIDLMSGLLQTNPEKRLDCTQTLKMPYFSNRPAPSARHQLPLPNSLLDNGQPTRKRHTTDKWEGGPQPKRLIF